MKKNIYFLFVLIIMFSCSKPKAEKQEELADFLPQSEIAKVAKNIERYLQDRKGTQVYSLFDGEEFYKRLSISSRQNPQVRVTEVSKIAENTFVKNIMNSLEITSDSSKVYWIEAKEQKGDYVQLSFIWENDVDLSFFEIFLTRNKEGKIVICDYLDYMLGELSSKSIDRFIANRIKYNSKPNSEMNEAIEKLNKINELLQQEKYEEAYSIYESIPFPFNKEPVFLNTKLGITSRISLPLYLKTLKEVIGAETCRECKSLYKFYIAIAEEDKNKQHLYWSELKNSYKNKEKLELIEKSYFSSLEK